MIDIKRGRAVDQFAHEWFDKICHFFGDRRVAYIELLVDGKKKRRECKSYAQKLIYNCIQVVNSYSTDIRVKKACLKKLHYCWIHIDEIILASPQIMQAKVDVWEKRKIGTIKLIEALSPVLVWFYEKLPKDYGYFIVNKLNLKTCPYCNRLFIQSFKGIRAERPELDHFHPKADYPIFCLSFYNLIPACHSCNHVKSEDSIRVNPYHRPFRRKFIITDKNGNTVSKSKIYRLTEKDIRLAFNGKDADEEKNDNVLGLTEVYNLHTDYVKELIDKSMAYDAHARKALVESFQGVGHHPRQVYDFVWGRHLMDAEYGDRPLSKLTKDILDLLDIIR